MATSHPDLFAALAEPIHPGNIRERNQGGRKIAYITARTVMNRLDSVLGPENWWDDYSPGEKSVLCRLTIRLPDGSTLTKADAGGYAGMSDAGDDEKSGFSDSFKRAAVKFGIARELYGDGVARLRDDDQAGKFAAEGRDLKVARPEPEAPAPAREKPRGNWGNGQASRPDAGRRDQAQPDRSCPIKSGKELFGFIKDQEQRHQIGVMKYVNSWAKLQDFPGRIVDWNRDQVALAYAEIERKLASIESQEPAYAEVG